MERKNNQGEQGIIKSIVALFDQVAFAPATVSTGASCEEHTLFVCSIV